MEYRILGRTGLRVSAVALGCEGFIHKTPEEVCADFDFAIGHGVNFIDIYSPNPELRTNIGAALEGRRGDFVIQGHLCTTWENGQYLLNQARIENWGAEADAAWRIGGGWSVNANYSWLRMEYPVPATPEHKLYAGGDFGKGRWSVSTGVQYIAGLYTAAAPDPEVREAGFVLWNLRASLRVNRLLTIFVRGENLLAERYEINAGYPMPRATVFGGLKLNL